MRGHVEAETFVATANADEVELELTGPVKDWRGLVPEEPAHFGDWRLRRLI